MARIYGHDENDTSKTELHVNAFRFNPIQIVACVLLGICLLIGCVVIFSAKKTITWIPSVLSLHNAKKVCKELDYEKIDTDVAINLVKNDKNSIPIDVSRGVYAVLESKNDIDKYAESGLKQPGAFEGVERIIITTQGNDDFSVVMYCLGFQSLDDARAYVKKWMSTNNPEVITTIINTSSLVNVTSSDDVEVMNSNKNGVSFYLIHYDVNDMNTVAGIYNDDKTVYLITDVEKSSSWSGQAILDNLCSSLDIISPTSLLRLDNVDNNTISTNVINSEYIGIYSAGNEAKTPYVLNSDGTCVYSVSPDDETTINGYWDVNDGILTMKPDAVRPKKDDMDSSEYEKNLQRYHDNTVHARIVNAGLIYKGILYTKK